MNKTKFAIGCLVQWYEIEIVSEYIDSLISAIDSYSLDNVIIDITFTTNQDLEVISDSKSILDIYYDFYVQTNKLKKYNTNIRFSDKLTTISDYRREFNSRYCEKVDLLIWGESDMLLPKQAFTVLNYLHINQSNKTPKYLATFAICKMWDTSWKPLEHVDFTNKPFIEGDTKNWWSLRYTMSKTEMNKFNDKVSELDVNLIQPHKFNGCGLVISSEVIKAGVNIPQSVFFVHEDTAFMLMTQRILGEIPQYHFKNILVVHNRKHPNKRSYIKGEENIDKTDTGALRKAHQWYSKANKMSEENCYNLFNPAYKFKTWNDVWK